MHDCGPDASDDTIRVARRGPRLGAPGLAVPQLRPARGDPGRHGRRPAASGSSPWTRTASTTPRTSAALLDTAMTEQAAVVYAEPDQRAAARRVAQRRLARRQVARRPAGRRAPTPALFHSFRLVLGEVAPRGRGVRRRRASTSTSRSPGSPTAPPPARWRCAARATGRRATPSAAWSATSGGWCSPAAPDRCGWVSALGAAARAARRWWSPSSWSSGGLSGRWHGAGLDLDDGRLLMVASGVILFALGIIAEYVGVAVNMAMGKPLYLLVRDRRDGPARPGRRVTRGRLAAPHLGRRGRRAARPSRRGRAGRRGARGAHDRPCRGPTRRPACAP